MSPILLQAISGSTAWILTLGFLFGLQHATETDHLAAVSTIVSERKSLWGSAVVGGFWGVGHTISLLFAGSLVLLFRFQLFKFIGGESENAKNIFEFAVGIMLVLLGLNLLRNLLFGKMAHSHRHEHEGNAHAHPHPHKFGHTHDHSHNHGSLFSPRAVIVGMIHGLAGSGVLILGVVSAIESPIVGFLYLLVFGFGSIGGMMIMSVLLSLPLRITALRFQTVNFLLCCFAGLASIGVGLSKIYEEGFAKGLFS